MTSRMGSLFLVHPWLDTLLERGGNVVAEEDTPPSPNKDVEEVPDDSEDNGDISRRFLNLNHHHALLPRILKRSQ